MDLTPFTCPNCGAPLKGFQCEYCGTEFFQWETPELTQVKLQLFQEQIKAEELYKSAIKAFRNYHF